MALDSRAELAVGYNHLGPQHSYDSYGAGVFLGVAVEPIKRLGLVLEAAANPGTTIPAIAGDPRFDLRFRSAQIGPRVRISSHRGALAMYAQFLIGVSRYGERLVYPSVFLDWVYQDHLILQPGVGVDLRVLNHFSIRAGVGLSFIAFKSTPCGSGCEPYTDWATQLRSHVGIVLHTGGPK
jgi:hypothetical protein